MSFRGAGLIGLVLVLCVGAILRLHDLTGQSFWLDEACSVAIAQSPLDSLVQQTAADVHPPLYYLLLHYWMLATDRSEFSVRLFSVVIGLAGIAAVFFVTRRLFTPATALIAAAILAALPFHIHHSQEARMYGLLALLATLSMHGFLATLGPQPSRRAIAGYLAASAAMLYTHAYGFFVLAAQLAYIGCLIVNAPSAVRLNSPVPSISPLST